MTGRIFFTFTAESDSSLVDPVEKNRTESEYTYNTPRHFPFARVVSVILAATIFVFARGSRYELETAGRYVHSANSKRVARERMTVKYDLHPVFYILLGYPVYTVLFARIRVKWLWIPYIQLRPSKATSPICPSYFIAASSSFSEIAAYRATLPRRARAKRWLGLLKVTYARPTLFPSFYEVNSSVNTWSQLAF